MTIDAHIFRAYDIRGTMGKTLSAEIVTAIGQALGSEALDQQQKEIIVARDGRLSGPELLSALVDGIRSTGCGVIDIGAVPTPILYFAAKTLDTRSGVMLTGSHNPPADNGLKMVIADETLSGDRIQWLKQRIDTANITVSDNPGALVQTHVVPAYFEHIVSQLKLKHPLKVVIDAGNGIAGSVAPELFAQLGCEVIPLYCDVDGHFPNHHPDPSCAENLQALIQTVKQHNAHIGIAFDGDGDRLGVVTANGHIIWSDQLIMLFAQDVLAKQPNAKIIFDVKCSRLVAQAISDAGGEPVMSATGHSNIKKCLREIKAKFAGEMSGHLFFADDWFGFDDGLYAAARLLHYMSEQQLDLDQWLQALPQLSSTPEINIAVADDKKFVFIERIIASAPTYFEHAKIITLDGVRVEFNDGWGLVRVSNTSPKMVLRFEADNAAALERIQAQFRTLLLNIDADLKF